MPPTSSNLFKRHGISILASGISLRLGCALFLVILIWLAVFWAITEHAA